MPETTSTSKASTSASGTSTSQRKTGSRTIRTTLSRFGIVRTLSSPTSILLLLRHRGDQPRASHRTDGDVPDRRDESSPRPHGGPLLRVRERLTD